VWWRGVPSTTKLSQTFFFFHFILWQNLLGPPQTNRPYEVDVTGGLESMMEWVRVAFTYFLSFSAAPSALSPANVLRRVPILANIPTYMHDSQPHQAKNLKIPFEKEVLKVLGQASSHHEIWLELHPLEVGSSHSGADGAALTIEANLKGKSRAREKAVMDYKGDIRYDL
jgi:hypothetical protein